MTQRLYYDDSYTMRFTAHIVEHLTVKDLPAVILDQTYFYPTSGGQPHDIGIINNLSVTDVQVREDDGAVVHVLENVLSAQEVEAQVDWARRFDHMQHHTGQHILTQAFVQTADVKTVGFHLSPDTVTIDLDTDTLHEAAIDTAEDLANQVIFENRAVQAKVREMDDQEGVRIRRLPRHILTEGLRVIEIEDFDLTACGGTHVAHTGEIGMIKILKAEKRGAKTRVEFRCGKRALQDYRETNRVAHQLAADLNCRFPEVSYILNNLREDLKTAQATLKSTSAQLLEYEAAQLLASSAQGSENTIIIAAYENRAPDEVRLLTSKLTTHPKTIALLAVIGEKSQLFFARSDDLSYNMGAMLKTTLSKLGGRGGGQPNFAQGGGLALDRAAAENLLHNVVQELETPK